MAAIFNPGASRATNVAAYKTKLADFISVQPDGSRRVNRAAFMKFMLSEMDEVILLNPQPANARFTWNNIQAQLEAQAVRLEQAVNSENWVADPDWPLSPTSSTRAKLQAEMVAKVDQYQGETIQAAHNIINYFEGKLRGLKDFVRTWIQNKVLTVLPGDPGSFPPADPVLPQESRTYVWTHVTDREEESDWSPTSEIVTVDPRDTVVVARPTIPTGKNITHWRLYRSSTTNSGAAFQYVPEGDEVGIPVATASVTDDNSQAELEETGQTRGWLPPPANLRGLVSMPNDFLAGFYDQTLCFSPPGYPHAWPMEYRLTTEPPIVGLAVVDQTLFIGTRAHPYIAQGASPESMSMVRLDVHQPVMSKRSMAVGGGGVFFAGADGLCFYSGLTVKVLTHDVFTLEQWRALNPESMICRVHEGTLYLLYDNGTPGCYVFDVEGKKIGTLDLTGSTLYVDRYTDTLFAASGTAVNHVFGGTTNRTARWKSKKFVLPSHKPFAWLHVESDFVTPVQVKVWADGVLRHTASVTSMEPVRLPAGRYREWEVELQSTSPATAYLLAGGTDEIKSV